MNEKLVELLALLRALDMRTTGVLVRFVGEAVKSRDPYRFVLEAMNDKLEKEGRNVVLGKEVRRP